MGEDLVLYKDRGGRYGLVDRHCPHRRADMSYGWVEETGIRCSYHGWLVDETGRCLEQPYEDTTNPKPSKAGCETKAYPVKECAGLLFAYMGPLPAPELPVWEPFTWAQRLSRDRARRRAVQLVSVPGELHRSGAFRMDARQLGRPACAAAMPTSRRSISSSSSRSSTTASSTSACARARARRTATGPSGASRCGRTVSISAAISNGACRSTTRTRSVVAWFFVRVPKGREPYVQERVPTWKSPIKDENGRWITSHVINQDIVAWVGQGRIADRTKEHLRSSDIGITMMRNRFFEEIEAMAAGKEPGGIIRSANEAQCIALPNMARELNTEGLTLAEFDNDPLLRQRLKEFRHHYGQPAEVRREFVEAMGISG